jgi:hypothetical protein
MNRNALIALQLRRGLIYRHASGWRVLDRFAGVDVFDDETRGFASEDEAILGLCFDAECFADYHA